MVEGGSTVPRSDCYSVSQSIGFIVVSEKTFVPREGDDGDGSDDDDDAEDGGGSQNVGTAMCITYDIIHCWSVVSLEGNADSN